MRKDVVLPSWLNDGVKPLKNSYPKRPNLIVFATETESRETGDPYLLTFYDGVKPVYLRVTPKTILQEFMAYLHTHCPKRQFNILFAHNLEFDLTAALSLNQETIFSWRKPPTRARYCRAEIKAEYELAKYILGIHETYDVGYTVSVAQLGSKIFRKFFLKDRIPQPVYPVKGLAEFCIHGGRAECFVPYHQVIPA